MVIWITGLSGAGKTTLCNALRDILKPTLRHLVVLDGEGVRAIFDDDLGHTEPDRHRQIGRIQRLAKSLSDQGLVVLVGALYAHPDLLAWNRANLGDYFEVYIKAPLDLVRSRDIKDLYGRAADGRMPDVVGIDIPWHEPANPDLLIDAEQGGTPGQLARLVIGANPLLQGAGDPR